MCVCVCVCVCVLIYIISFIYMFLKNNITYPFDFIVIGLHFLFVSVY